MKQTKRLTLGLALILTSCSATKKTSGIPSQNNSRALTSLVLTSAPKNALDIADLRTSGTPGDTVTFTGQILGKNPAFTRGRAVMIMGDPKKLTSCNLHHGDGCRTPWDVCCDDQDVIKASILTVQVVDSAGKPIKTSLKGLAGMKELSEVTVAGKIAESSTQSNMLINATGIFVQP